MPFIARPAKDPNQPHPCLVDHNKSVAELARGFATQWGGEDYAYLSGLWHDHGKFNPDWQTYLRNSMAAGTRVGGVPHAITGALHAMNTIGFKDRNRLRQLNDAIVYAIAGHHSGLHDYEYSVGNEASLEYALRVDDPLNPNPNHALYAKAQNEFQNFPELDFKAAPTMPSIQSNSPLTYSMFVRMTASCLIDADRLHSELSVNDPNAQHRGAKRDLTAVLDHFNAYMARFADKQQTAVNKRRADLLRQCRERALDQVTLFKLTAPTGLGKTLAGTAFGLEHAVRHDKRRLIYVAPYITIIEQTARVMREALGEGAVIEHHSNVGDDDLGVFPSLARENWDAPVIVTTAVQFFESLFAYRTKSIRKLHNIANSVVFIDEVQFVPPSFVSPSPR